MRVTETEIDFVKPRDGLVAFACVVIDDQLYLSGIAIHRKLAGDGYRLTYPTRIVGDRPMTIFHPIRRPIARAIEDAIIAKLKDVVNLGHVGHGRPHA